MKATLEFTLPEESNEHRLAIDGSAWFAVCWDLDQHWRAIERHSTNSDNAALAAEMRELLRGVMYKHGVDFDSVE